MTVASEVKEYYNLINGKMIPSSTGETFDSIDPATGKVWAKIPRATKEDANDAIMAARAAFPEWSATTASERSELLYKIGDLIMEHSEELAMLETKGNGWVIRETSYGLIPVLKDLWSDAASAAVSVTRGETVSMGPTSFGFTLREPLGVILGILPWNSPLFTFTIKAANALATGNTVVIKPSKEASVSVLRYAEIINSVLPAGVLNVIAGSGSELGDYLVSHNEVNKVSLTGSGGTASTIAKATAANPKPMILELGGKSPNIIFEDADIEKTISGITDLAIYTGNAGQICVGGSRILVQRSIFDEVVNRMKEKMTNPELTVLGDTMSVESTMGPIATKSQFDKVKSYIEIAKEEGGEIIFGGKTGKDALSAEQKDLHDGYWVQPTLIKVEDNSLRVCQEEIFGPVAVIMPFDTEAEAIEIANDTDYGLAAGVWTTDLARAHRMVQSIHAGNVWVNTYGRVGADLPFGGVKASGYGVDTALEYTREKASVIEL